MSERKVLRLPVQDKPEPPSEPIGPEADGGAMPPTGPESQTPEIPESPDGGQESPISANGNGGMDGGGSEFDTNFDPGVDANEDEDPKKYIQQLTGKLSQSLRKYNQSQAQPDVDLSKYVAGMVLSQSTAGLSYEDKQDILDKLNQGNEADGMGGGAPEQGQPQPMGSERPPMQQQQTTPQGGEGNMPQQQMPQANESVKRSDEEMLSELFQELSDPDEDEQGQKHNEIRDIGYRKTPFTSPNFK